MPGLPDVDVSWAGLPNDYFWWAGLSNVYVGQVYQMTTNFEKFVEFNGVLQEWKVLRDEKDAEQVKSQFVIF